MEAATALPGATRLVELPTAREALARSERLLAETGSYQGITGELARKAAGPIPYERLHTQLREAVISARENAREISASPGIREQGEFVVALYTVEGDAIVLSTGIMVHVHTMSRFIKWMIERDYERDPGVNPGDIFGNNDPFIGNVQVADMMNVVPVHYGGTLVGWAGAVAHELDVGGVEPGGEVQLVSDRFGEGMFVSAEKIGAGDALRRDYLIRCERNLRSSIYWILDEKAKSSACQAVRDRVLEIIDAVGFDTYLETTREFIEENRRAQLERVRTMTVPGTYRTSSYLGHMAAGRPGMPPLAARDLLFSVPLELTITGEGRLQLDFEGTSPRGSHALNCTPAAMDGGLFIALTQAMGYEGKVNDGAWMATDMHLPPGTWTNPLDEKCATSCSWVLLSVGFAAFQRLLSRAFLARGFREEIFVGGVPTPFMEGGGINQFGELYGAGNFECASGGSGARGIMDGLDTGYAIWNPEADMGNAEVWEMTFPFLYLGRRNTIDSAGAGKYRGGTGFTSVWKVHRTPMTNLNTKEHSGRVLDQAGICGGYPAPTAQRHYAIRNTDLAERIAAREPLPHALSTDGSANDLLAHVSGEVDVQDGPYAGNPFADGDVFHHSYSSSGGYGDPIERDPASVADDVEQGLVSRRAALVVYGVAVGADGEVDPVATARARAERRRERLAGAVPARQWIEAERSRVQQHDFIPEVRECYAGCMRLSPRFAEEFRAFWSLGAGFSFEEER